MFDVCSFGELLIDFTPVKKAEYDNLLFERNPGGAPANVAAAAAKFGLRSAFLGKVGDDLFGTFLRGVLRDRGVDVRGLRTSTEYRTMLAFVELSDAGDRSFSFYRNPGADMTYSEEDIDREVIAASKVFHFGSLMMTAEPARSATLALLHLAKQKGVLISFDPNLRPPLWNSLTDAKREIETALPFADVLKVSGEEMEFLTGTDDLAEGSRLLMAAGPSLVFVTLGPGGCFYRRGEDTGRCPAYDTTVIDTTGSGDAFHTAALYKLMGSGKKINGLSKEELADMADFGNAAGSLTAAKRGAIPALPSVDDIERCRREVPRLIL